MTDTVPQDTSLPDDVVERAARAAVADLAAQHNEMIDGPYLYDDDNLTSVGVDGHVHIIRLVRVVAAALKAEG